MVNFSLERTKKVQKVKSQRKMGVGGQHHASAALPPGKRPGTHFIEGWMGPRADRVQKVSHLLGYDTRTVQHVANLCTAELSWPTV